MEDCKVILANARRHPKGKFDLRFIHLVLKEIEEGLPLSSASSKYNISVKLIRTWNRKYGNYDLPVLRRLLSMQEKRTLLRAITTGRLSIQEAALAYGVGESSVHHWVKEYTKENEELSLSNQQELTKNKPKQKPDLGSQQVRQLQQQLADAQLKIAALNTLIDVAEEQLKINIRKKPGAKRS